MTRAGGGRLAPFVRDAYGVLLGALPILSIASSNAGEYTDADLALVLGIAVLGFVTIYLLSLLVLRRRDPRIAGFITALAAAWVWCYLPVHDAVYSIVPVLGSHRVLLPVGVAATVALLVVLARHQQVSAGLARWLAATSCIAAVWLTASIIRADTVARRSIANSRFLQTLAAPVPLRALSSREPGSAGSPRTGARSRPDIYVILLDGYAGEHALREFLEFDNTPFTDSLRALGFVVPHRVVSNYMQTVLSLPSFLNMTLLTPLIEETGDETRNLAPLFRIIEHNRAMRLAKATGYHVIGFPSSWWRGTSRMPEADDVFRAYARWNVREWIGASEFRQVAWNRSIFRMVWAWNIDGAVLSAPAFALRTFEGLEHVPEDARPTFVFAHLMLPHPPYALDARCRIFRPATWHDAWRRSRPGYVNQVLCANRLVLALVHTILERSQLPPVIVLQSDHGSRVTLPMDPQNGIPTIPQLREAFDTFGAYYLPGDSAGTFRDGVSVVNVLRAVFSHYAGAELPPLRDSLFYSTRDFPLKLTPIDTTPLYSPPTR